MEPVVLVLETLEADIRFVGDMESIALRRPGVLLIARGSGGVGLKCECECDECPCECE